MTRQQVLDTLEHIADKPDGYFTHEDNYWDLVDGAEEYDEKYDGGLMNVEEVRVSMDHQYRSALLCLGSTGNSYIYLDTKRAVLYAYHDKKAVEVEIDRDKNNIIDDNIKDMFYCSG